MIGTPHGQPTAPIVYSDMAACRPRSALSEHRASRHWRLVPYRTEDFAGTMLVADEETNAPELRFPLDVTGWHRITIGIYQVRWEGAAAIQVKLSDDLAFSVLTVPAGPQPFFWDVEWKTADLTNRDLVFRQLRNVLDDDDRPEIVRQPGAHARLAYVRLDPLTDEEVAALEADRADRSHRRLWAHDDMNGFIWSWGARSAEDIHRTLEPYRDTDFSRIYWETAMGDLLSYLGTSGRLQAADGIEDFTSVGNRIHAENWRWFRQSSLDPLKVALEYAHAMGLELHAAYRPAGFFFPPFDDHWNTGGFYEQHPELRMVNRDGSNAPRIAFTFPESRRYVLSILRECAEYGVDGISILFIRRPPLVGYEPPLVEAFRAETGLDAHALPDGDERWIRFRCGVLNEFMRELRAELDAVAREMGRTSPFEVTVMVSARHEENLRYGMDLATWIAEGTVDSIIPYTMAPELDSATEAWPDPAAADSWLELVRGTGVKLSLSILPRWKTPEDYRRIAKALYERGAESLFFWDCGGQRVNFLDQFAWNAIRSLGHREAVLAWPDPGPPAEETVWGTGVFGVPVGTPADATKRRRVLEIGGYDMSFRTPG